MKKEDFLVTDFSQTPDFPQIEGKIAQFWEENEIFQKSLAQTVGHENFVFYDGPPFATGLPHYGHLVASTTKDVFPRFQTMLGKYVKRVWGWDCHGLPIENLVEKELNLKDRQAIENYGVDNFCEACRGKVQLYSEEWKKTIKRLGRFVDMENDYKTMDPNYMEKIWGVFQQLWDKGLIYKDYKSMHICPRCSTPLSNSEVTQAYKEITDISVFVKFKLKKEQNLNLNKSTFFVAWTTTPWTLPGNFLLAIQQQIEYSIVELEENCEELLIIASERLKEVLKEKKYKIIRALKGVELIGREYEPLMPYFAETKNAFRVVEADFVTTNDGTGIVHIAPAYGDDDFQIGKREELKIIHHVNMDGKIIDEVTDFAGLEVRPLPDHQQTDIEIIKYLAKKGKLFGKQKIKHSYPHCWRCDYPLLNYATSSFFVKVTALKNELLINNQRINWLPEHFKSGRFGKWLEGARDWAISRNRFWGTPLPLWQSETGDFICVGSIKELEALSGGKITDLHKNFVDKITFKYQGKNYSRVDEVLDCWFESGSMPYAQDNFPADFISEGQDQTRGWFYTLHVLATALKNEPAFKNVLVNGVILASDGKKMSKKLQNYPDPNLIFDRYGADALRLYLMSSPIMKAENLNFEEEDVARIRRQFNVTLWNTFAFYKNLPKRNSEEVNDRAQLHVLDRYLRNQTQKLTEELTESLLHYEVIKASKMLLTFVDQLSNWYLRQSRERLKTDQQGREVFRDTLKILTVLIAPLTPFMSELLYQHLEGSLESVHLEKWPEVNAGPDDLKEEIEFAMNYWEQLIKIGHAERKKLGIKVRQPLTSVEFIGVKNEVFARKLKSNKRIQEEFWRLLRDELNVKKIDFVPADTNEIRAVFETELTQELIDEGKARELIREISSERKKRGLQNEDEWTYEVTEIPSGWQTEIERKTKTKIKLLSNA